MGAEGKSKTSLLGCHVKGAYSDTETLDWSPLMASWGMFRRVAVVTDCAAAIVGIVASLAGISLLSLIGKPFL